MKWMNPKSLNLPPGPTNRITILKASVQTAALCPHKHSRNSIVRPTITVANAGEPALHLFLFSTTMHGFHARHPVMLQQFPHRHALLALLRRPWR
jgi:hypothetical protein